MDNNSTYVPGMNNSANSDINPYAQPNAGSGTVIPGMQPNRVPTPEPPATIIRKTKRFAITERAVYFLKTKRTAGGTPPP